MYTAPAPPASPVISAHNSPAQCHRPTRHTRLGKLNFSAPSSLSELSPHSRGHSLCLGDIIMALSATLYRAHHPHIVSRCPAQAGPRRPMDPAKVVRHHIHHPHLEYAASAVPAPATQPPITRTWAAQHRKLGSFIDFTLAMTTSCVKWIN